VQAATENKYEHQDVVLDLGLMDQNGGTDPPVDAAKFVGEVVGFKNGLVRVAWADGTESFKPPQLVYPFIAEQRTFSGFLIKMNQMVASL
jgi:hypothetical protein